MFYVINFYLLRQSFNAHRNKIKKNFSKHMIITVIVTNQAMHAEKLQLSDR